MAIDHFGITAPARAGARSSRATSSRLVASGEPERRLIGLGHPVGATGVRMALDCYKQVTGQAGDCQVEGARRFATLNVGAARPPTVSLVVDRAD